jgi:homoserine kinase type II
MPVSTPVPSSDGRLQVEVGKVSMCLQRVIRGVLLDVADPAQVRAAGVALAQLHHALAAYTDADPGLPSAGGAQRLAVRVGQWLDSGVEHVPAVARDTLRRLAGDAPDHPMPTQLVHGDFRSSNIVCAGTTVAAVLDFEEVRHDCCIDEVARSAVMLGTRFREWGPVSAEVRETFLAGYQSVRRLTSAEASWWDVLVLWYSLAFVPPGDDPTGWGPSALSQLAALDA